MSVFIVLLVGSFVFLSLLLLTRKDADCSGHWKTKADFTSLVSHELLTPMSTISWYTEMLLNDDAGKLNKEQRQYIETIYAGNKKMSDLVHSLLNVSRLESDTFRVEPELLDISEVLQVVVKEFTEDIKTKEITVKEKFDKVPKISADKNLLSVVFRNFMSNAVKFSSTGGNIDAMVESSDGFITVSIQDDGMGIPEKQQDKVFSALFRGDNAREAELAGSGLGLYIANYIIEYAGGAITFESSEAGTKFLVSVPITGMSPKEGTKKIS